MEYVIKHDFHHPVLNAAQSLPTGWSSLEDGQKDDSALDYVRGNLFRANELKPIPHFLPGPQNDLFEHVEDLYQRAKDDPSAVIYAFGERWGPEESKADQYFDFKPGNGVHLIHMNQGDHQGRNNKFRDGGLIFEFDNARTAVALFIKFQSQSWHTDETTAAPIEGAPVVRPIEIPVTGDIRPWPVVAENSPYKLARIIAAMVNPIKSDEGSEFVTILNISNTKLNLSGWSLLDRNDKAEPLSGAVNPGETITLRLDGKGAQLSNNGGTITLLNEKGLKVDGVSYTKRDASSPGTPVWFLGATDRFVRSLEPSAV